MTDRPQQPQMVGVTPEVAGYLLDQLARTNAALTQRVNELEQQQAEADEPTRKE